MINYLAYAESHCALTKENFDLLFFQLNKRIWYHSPYWNGSIGRIYCTSNKANRKLAIFHHFLSKISQMKKKILRYYDEEDIIVFEGYFNSQIDLPYKTVPPLDFSFVDMKHKKKMRKIAEMQSIIENEGLEYLLSSDMNSRLEEMKSILYDLYADNRIKAFFSFQDCEFWTRLLLLVFRRLKKPSFVYIHGMPEIYRTHRSDFLLVWSKKMQENYIEAGVSPDRIFIIKDLKYYKKPVTMKPFSLDKVIVFGYSICGAVDTSSMEFCRNFSIGILFAEMVKTVLQKYNVKRAVFKPHPSENPEWYVKNIDQSFYSVETTMNQGRLFGSVTLAIGPTSTMLIDSVYHGVPYILFEPVYGGEELSDFKACPPFDGTDKFVPVCRTEDDLYNAIQNRRHAGQNVFYEYIDGNCPELSLETIIKDFYKT